MNEIFLWIHSHSIIKFDKEISCNSMHNLQLFFMPSRISLLKTTTTKITVIWLSLFVSMDPCHVGCPFFSFTLIIDILFMKITCLFMFMSIQGKGVK